MSVHMWHGHLFSCKYGHIIQEIARRHSRFYSLFRISHFHSLIHWSCKVPWSSTMQMKKAWKHTVFASSEWKNDIRKNKIHFYALKYFSKHFWRSVTKILNNCMCIVLNHIKLQTQQINTVKPRAKRESRNFMVSAQFFTTYFFYPKH
jgi:hypothetical protein